MPRLLRLSLVFLLAVLVGTAVNAFTASNTVPVTSARSPVLAITPNDLKPAECAALNLTALIVGSGNINGTAANELIIGAQGGDRVTAGDGDDCVVTGGARDRIDCGLGTDVALSGQGGDINVDQSCETFIQQS